MDAVKQRSCQAEENANSVLIPTDKNTETGIEVVSVQALKETTKEWQENAETVDLKINSNALHT